MSENITSKYVPTSRKPIQFKDLRPGSYFAIVSEPSRKIRHSNDTRIYRRATDGFYSYHPVTGVGCVLFPYDTVMPMRKVKA